MEVSNSTTSRLTYLARRALRKSHAARLPAAILMAACGIFIFHTEIRWLGVAVASSALVFVYCVFRLFSCGPFLSAYLSTSVMLLIFAISKFKFWLTARRLHPFDVYVYGSWRNLFYIPILYPQHYMHVYLTLLALFSLTCAIFYCERSVQFGRRHIAAFASIIIASFGFNLTSHYLDGGGYGPGNRFMHFDHQHISTFFIAGLKAFPTLMRGRYFEYGSGSPSSPAVVAALKDDYCIPNERQQRPNIVIVLRESVMIPASMASMKAPHLGNDQFASGDGRTHRLRVETHGAGSAHAILSILSGLSSDAFGPNKILDLDLAQRHLHYSLAKFMATCGYRTIAVSSGIEGYVASKEFYAKLGFDELYDMRAVAAKNKNIADFTDRAIYSFVSGRLAEAAAADKPLFIYMDTTASHGPYGYPIRKEEHIEESVGVTNKEVAEYIRRVVLGERDRRKFLESQRQVHTAGGRGVVVLDFGDHQPSFTKTLPGHSGYVLEDERDGDDPHLITYFRLAAVGYQLAFAALPKDHALVGVPFLPDWLLRSLGWKIGGPFSVRWEMVERCRSRYWQCGSHGAAQEMHRALRDAGLISFR